jgi:hypothetical protein
LGGFSKQCGIGGPRAACSRNCVEYDTLLITVNSAPNGGNVFDAVPERDERVCVYGEGEGTCVLREVQDSTPVECNRALHALK